jgi:hypothetical protein
MENLILGVCCTVLVCLSESNKEQKSPTLPIFGLSCRMERGQAQRLGIMGICDSNVLPIFPVIDADE